MTSWEGEDWKREAWVEGVEDVSMVQEVGGVESGEVVEPTVFEDSSCLAFCNRDSVTVTAKKKIN